VRGETPFVADGRGELLVLEHLLQGVEGFHAGPQGVVERVEAQRHDHELLHVERIVGVGPAVDDVHHRRREEAGGGTAQVAIERQAAMLGGRVGHGHRDAEDRVRSELLLVRRAVELQHQFVDGGLIEGVDPLQFLGDPGVHVLHGLEHALAEIHALVAVPLLPGLVGAGAGARGHRGAAEGPVGEGDVDLDRGVAAAVEDLAGVDVDDRGHENSGESGRGRGGKRGVAAGLIVRLTGRRARGFPGGHGRRANPRYPPGSPAAAR